MFTLRANVTDQWIDDRLEELSSNGLIHLYAVDTRRYLVMHRYGKYNPGALLKVRPSFPPPPVGLCDCLMFHDLEEERPQKWRSNGPVGSSSLSGLSESESESDAPAYAPTGVEGLVKAAHFIKAPGDSAKSAAFQDLLRQGVDYGRIMTRLTSPEHRTWAFYEIVKSLQPGNGKPKKPSNECRHGKSLMYGISCRQCDKETP